MALYDSLSKQALFVVEVRYESNAPYFEAIRSLQKKGHTYRALAVMGGDD
ncbi:MAG: hypothetical protein Q4A06_03635 [Cardiobacteriaceae bacterium]|nr:hypothetical protein [Cardiobacteriaceae bacterium]